MLHLGFDIGGTKCAVVLGRTTGNQPEILGRKVFETASAASPHGTVERMCALGDELLVEAGLTSAEVASIGISCGGPLDSTAGLILSPPNLPGWDGIPVVRIVQEHFGVPVMLQNDANAGALAEWKFGAGKGLRNLIFITFGTGCGSGLILNGKLYAGTNDNAGECGHIRLAEYGPVGYGKAGGMEGFCSGAGIAQLGQAFLLEMVQKGKTSELCERYKAGEPVTAKLLAEYARKGDPAAMETYRTSAKKLGYGLSVLIDILNPEAILIGGVYSRCTDLIYEECINVIRSEALSLSSNVCRIMPAGLGEQIGDFASLAVASYSLEL